MLHLQQGQVAQVDRILRVGLLAEVQALRILRQKQQLEVQVLRDLTLLQRLQPEVLALRARIHRLKQLQEALVHQDPIRHLQGRQGLQLDLRVLQRVLQVLPKVVQALEEGNFKILRS